MNLPMFAVQRAHKSQPLADVLTFGLSRFRMFNGMEPTVAFVNPVDEAEVRTTAAVEIRPLTIVPAGSVYVGCE